jgi:signal transduction histidine kinase
MTSRPRERKVVRDARNVSGNGFGSTASRKTPATSVGSHIDSNTLAVMALLQAPASVVVCDIHGKITLVNDLARLTAKENPNGQSIKSAPSIWGELIDANGWPIPLEEWPSMKALQGHSIAAKEYELMRHDGKSHNVMISAAPLKTLEGSIVGAVIFLADVSRNKRQELIRLDEAVANDRTRIAGDIHDNVSQGLNVAVLQIRAARSELAQHVKFTRARLRQALETTMGSLAEARRATSMFSSSFSESEDPASALQWAARQLFSGLPVDLEFSFENPNQALSPEVRDEIVRIGKEALTNVVKHAKASKVCIRLKYYKNGAALNVVDNGRGFVNTTLPNTNRGYGLVSMRVRAERLGGELKVESQPDGGTSVSALIPLDLSTTPQERK